MRLGFLGGLWAWDFGSQPHHDWPELGAHDSTDGCARLELSSVVEPWFIKHGIFDRVIHKVSKRCNSSSFNLEESPSLKCVDFLQAGLLSFCSVSGTFLGKSEVTRLKARGV